MSVASNTRRGDDPRPPPDPTTAEMHATLVAALRARGYTVVGTRFGRPYWGKARRPVQSVLLREDAAA